MKPFTLAAAAAFACALATPTFAQAPAAPADIPKASCGTPPTLPGQKMMEDNTIRRRFEREIKAYGDCVKAYVSERQAAANALQSQAKAHADAANAAINEYNALMKKINEQASGK